MQFFLNLHKSMKEFCGKMTNFWSYPLHRLRNVRIDLKSQRHFKHLTHLYKLTHVFVIQAQTTGVQSLNTTFYTLWTCVTVFYFFTERKQKPPPNDTF
jgi:hypothetical protein